jgi:mevalonate kinase
MRIRLSAPSKTFLIGEYAVLDGGSALMAATAPRFEMRIESAAESLAGDIHSQSPAGRWVRTHAEDFKNIRMEFVDPHGGAGGFGASGAQFLFVNLWSRLKAHNLESLARYLSIDQIWKDFRRIEEESGKKVLSSGGDLVCQWSGGLSSFSNRPLVSEALLWPDEDMEFALVRTENKIATHQHLDQIRQKDFSALKQLSQEAVLHVKKHDMGGLLQNLHDFAKELEEQGLVSLPTRELLNRLRVHSSVLAAKGCGAMGADVIALFYEPRHGLEVASFVQSQGLNIIATSRDLSQGAKVSLDMGRVGETAGKSVFSPESRP